jgi:non-canonical purine NTP pyrophosphatase (RdgB/HAM1 family)
MKMQVDTLLLATRNMGKIEEFYSLMPNIPLRVSSLAEYDIPETEETGTTFEENARLKAESASQYTKLPTLADDSGLCVDALNGRPGVKTARYGDFARILVEMADIPPPLRTAQFECVLAYATPHKPTRIFKAHIAGSIVKTRSEMPAYGFGFDPFFIPEGTQKTYGEIPPAEKLKTSPRRQCFDAFITWRFPALSQGVF